MKQLLILLTFFAIVSCTKGVVEPARQTTILSSATIDPFYVEKKVDANAEREQLKSIGTLYKEASDVDNAQIIIGPFNKATTLYLEAEKTAVAASGMGCTNLAIFADPSSSPIEAREDKAIRDEACGFHTVAVTTGAEITFQKDQVILFLANGENTNASPRELSLKAYILPDSQAHLSFPGGKD